MPCSVVRYVPSLRYWPGWTSAMPIARAERRTNGLALDDRLDARDLRQRHVALGERRVDLHIRSRALLVHALHARVLGFGERGLRLRAPADPLPRPTHRGQPAPSQPRRSGPAPTRRDAPCPAISLRTLIERVATTVPMASCSATMLAFLRDGDLDGFDRLGLIGRRRVRIPAHACFHAARAVPIATTATIRTIDPIQR